MTACQGENAQCILWRAKQDEADVIALRFIDYGRNAVKADRGSRGFTR